MGNLKKPVKEPTEIPLAPVEEAAEEETTSSDEDLIVVPTGCGDNICAMEETCSNCEEDCGCSYNTYCNTTISPAACKPILNSTS